MTQEIEPRSAGLTAEIADFASRLQFDDIPADVIARGKRSLLDGLGTGLAGARAEGSVLLRRYLGQYSNKSSGATVIGSALRLPAPLAALANGTAIHADDFDDTSMAAPGKVQGVHPTAPVLAAVLAAAEQDARSGRQLLTSYHVGVEVTCKLFDATGVAHVLNGFHSTGTCGAIGAAAAASSLRALPASQIRQAFGTAASQCAGLQQNFGTMTKPFHAGKAAETGLASVELAGLGFSASQTALEGKRGFFEAYGGGYEPFRIEGRLGAPWSFADPGICIKPWPTGGLSHPGMTLLLDLVARHGLDRASIAEIVVRPSANVFNTLPYHRPVDALEARFSLEFCLAAVLVEPEFGVAHLNDAFVASDDLQSLMERITCLPYSDAEAAAEGYVDTTTLMEIVLVDGRRIGGRKDHAKGSLQEPMEEAEIHRKFRQCAALASMSADAANRMIALVGRLEELEDIRELTAMLSS
jgi:2-methylcitrate dehydratase PrpD